MRLNDFDETILKEDDEYETPTELFESLCLEYGITPLADVCATKENTKCSSYWSKEDNALHRDWLVDVWCNPPHSLTEQFVIKADRQWSIHHINILMIVPANAVCAKFFDSIFKMGHAKYYRISGRPRFLHNGKPAPNSSRNSYNAVVWKRLKV